MSAAVAIAAGCALALGAPGARAAAPERLGAAVVDRVAESPASVRAYWTPARMRAATPAGLVAPKAAAASAVNSARSHAAQPSRSAGRRVRLASPVRKASRSPTRAHGKVFFVAGPDRYECSGTAVRAPTRSLVLTTAHCTYLRQILGSGNAVHDWIFVPAYTGGRAPFGKWAATSLAAPAGWIDSAPVIGIGGEITGGDSRFDLGAATVAAHRHTLQAKVGGRRVAFRRSRRHRYTAFGYPAERPYSGRREFACSSGYRGADGAFGNPPPIKISCDMTAGASGGGWVDPRGRLASVTSYSYSNDPRSLYGPYFGVALRDFFGSVSGG
jgi:V8-like Glu-specific endopeptidase